MLIDLTTYMIGDGRQYDVTNTWNGSSERMQTQIDSTDHHRFYHVKNSNWEELWFTDKGIYRGTDTSPGNNEVYQLFENNVYGSLWAPRYLELNVPFKRLATVIFKNRDSGHPIPTKPAYQDTTWIIASSIHSNYIFNNNIVISNVLELHANSGPVFNKNSFEIYLYAKNYGLVGWIGQGVGKSMLSNDLGYNLPSLVRMNLDWVKSFQIVHDLASASHITPPKQVTPLPLTVNIPSANDNGWKNSKILPLNDYTNVRQFPTTNSNVVGKITKSDKQYLVNNNKSFNDGQNFWVPIKLDNWQGWARTDLIHLLK